MGCGAYLKNLLTVSLGLSLSDVVLEHFHGLVERQDDCDCYDYHCDDGECDCHGVFLFYLGAFPFDVFILPEVTGESNTVE